MNETSASAATALATSKPKLEYPYSKDELKQQLVLDVSKADHGLIKCIRPRQGTLTIVSAMLWHKLCDACRTRNILDMSSEDEFEEFFADSTIISAAELEQLKADSAAYQQSLISGANSAVAKPRITKAKKVQGGE